MRIFHCLTLSLLALVALSLGPAAQESAVTEHTLPNGLKIIALENHNAPVVNFNMAFRVGSKHERPGITGIAHLLEHIMFKTTTNHPLGEFDRLLQEVGAENNANTWLDRTIYYETIAADQLELAIRLDADRMRNLAFIPSDHELEMPVVRNELEQRNDSPEILLYEEMLTHAFKAHPYAIPTIGWVDDIEGITTQDIREFYDRWYHPDNCVIVAVGDFDTDWLIDKVMQYFGGIPASGVAQPRLPVEPRQDGERRFKLKRAGDVDYLMTAWHVPESEHPDSFALEVLGGVLGEGRTSRLYRALVDSGQAAGLWAGNDAFSYADPFLFMAGITLSPGVTPEGVEPLLYAEIEKIKADGITEVELERAKKQARASFVFDNDSIVSQADALLSFELYNSGWSNLYDYLPGIEAVTAADVQRVAQTYLTEDNRTVGYYLAQRGEEAGIEAGGPNGAAGGPARAGEALSHRRFTDALIPHRHPAEPVTSESISALMPALPAGATIAQSGSAYADVFTLPNGLTVIVRENMSNPSVSINGIVRMGAIDDPVGRPGTAALAAGMLDRGTEKWDKAQLAELEENNAISLSFGAGRENTTFAGRSLAEDFDTLLDLAAAELLTPTFPPAELELLRAQTLAQVLQDDNDTNARAAMAIREALYAPGNPFRERLSGTQASVAAITRDDIAAWYAEHCVPEGAIITVVGAVDDATVRDMVEQRFSGWSGTLGEHNARLARGAEFQPVAGQVARVNLPEKSNVTLMWAGPGTSRAGDGWFASSIANYILGGDFSARLNRRLRVAEGLTYGSYSYFSNALAAGPWVSVVEVNPDNVARAIEVMTEELSGYHAEGPSSTEIGVAKSYLTGNFPVRLLTNGAVAGALTDAVYMGRGVDYLNQYPDLVNAVTAEQVAAAIDAYIDPAQAMRVESGTLPE